MGVLVLSANMWLSRNLGVCLERANIPYAFAGRPDTRGALDGLQHLDYLNLPLATSRMHPSQLAAQIGGFAKPLNLTAVMASDIGTQKQLLHLKEFWPDVHLFPMPSAAMMDRFNDKWTFYQTLQEFGAPSPKTYLINAPADLEHLPDGPKMVKARDIGAGIGIHVAPTREILLETAHNMPAHMVPFIVQDFIEGEDCDVSILAQDGDVHAICTQRWVGESTLSFTPDEELENMARELVKKTKFSGAVHFDLRRCAKTNKPYFIEANPRIWSTISAAAEAGLNFAEIGYALATDQEFHAQTITPCEIEVHQNTLPNGQLVSARGLTN